MVSVKFLLFTFFLSQWVQWRKNLLSLSFDSLCVCVCFSLGPSTAGRVDRKQNEKRKNRVRNSNGKAKKKSYNLWLKSIPSRPAPSDLSDTGRPLALQDVLLGCGVPLPSRPWRVHPTQGSQGSPGSEVGALRRPRHFWRGPKRRRWWVKGSNNVSNMLVAFFARTFPFSIGRSHSRDVFFLS